MKTALSLLLPLLLAACSDAGSPPTTSSAPPITPNDPPIGHVGLAQGVVPDASTDPSTGSTIGPPDAGPDAYLNWWIDPDGATGGNNLVIYRIPSDGAIGCPAPAALASAPWCTQEELDPGYYYTNNGVGMFDDQGNPVSGPSGNFCPAGNYEIFCTLDLDDAGYGTWPPPPASLGCRATGGGDYISGNRYCCPCQ